MSKTTNTNPDKKNNSEIVCMDCQLSEKQIEADKNGKMEIATIQELPLAITEFEKHEVQLDEEKGISRRIVAGKEIRIDLKRLKDIKEAREKQGRSITTKGPIVKSAKPKQSNSKSDGIEVSE